MSETEEERRAKAIQFIKDCGFTSSECCYCKKTVDSLHLGQLMRCGRCRLAYYCGMKCVQDHFEEHKEVCLLGQKYGSFIPPTETVTELPSSGLSREKVKGAKSFCAKPRTSTIPSKAPSKASSFCVPSSSSSKDKDSNAKSGEIAKIVQQISTGLSKCCPPQRYESANPESSG